MERDTSMNATIRRAEVADLPSITESASPDFVIGLEQSLWNAVVRKDGDRLARLLATDYVEITLEGKRVEPSDVVSSSPQIDDIAGYVIDSPKIISLDDNNAILTYHLTLDGHCRGEPILPRERWATSVWSRIDGQWLCRFFQQSKFAPPDVEATATGDSQSPREDRRDD